MIDIIKKKKNYTWIQTKTLKHGLVIIGRLIEERTSVFIVLEIV